MAYLPTVKLWFPHETGDFCTINESDFDPAQHTRYADHEAGGEGEAEVNATAAALAVLEAAGIDPATVEGTGKDGRITKADAERAVAEQAAGGN